MKRKPRFLFLCAPCALLLPVSSALAQVADSQSSNDLLRQVALARCAYTRTEAVCTSAEAASQDVPGLGGKTTLAQIPRPVPGRPPILRPPMRMMAHPMPMPSLRHAAIGALIGFLLGVAHPNDNTVKGHVTLGVFVGLIGAALGAGIPDHSYYSNPRGRWPDDDEEATRSKPEKSKVAASKPGSPRAISPSPSSTPAEDPLPAAETP